MIHRNLRLALIAGCALSLSACDAIGGGESAPAETKSTTLQAGNKSKAGTELDHDMVMAVSPGKPGAPVELKFKVLTRPKVGETVDVEVALVPVSELERLQVSFQGSSGLSIHSGNAPDPFVRPAVGVPLKHRITATANTDGIFYITATALADSSAGSLARSFSIPIIVGDGVAALPQKSMPPADATGERIKSAPAQEPGHTHAN
jgi:hypothetical protein